MRKFALLFAALSILLSANLVAAQGVGVAANEQAYTVQPRDNLVTIAQAFDVDPNAILIRNNIIDPNRIFVGQILIIPSQTSAFPQQHIVQPGERLSDIATRYNTTVDVLIQLNLLGNANVIFPGQVLHLPMAGPIPTHPPTSSDPITYHVQAGDTLFSIARRFDTTVDAIVAANGIPHPDYIQAGMTLIIPGPDFVPVHPPVVPQPPSTITYVVQPGDTLSQIAHRFDTTVDAIRQFNNIADNNTIFPGQVLIIPASETPPHMPANTGYEIVDGRYTVRPGDTLFRIANAFGVNVFDIAEANGIFNLNHIFVGQRLRIPGFH